MYVFNEVALQVGINVFCICCCQIQKNFGQKELQIKRCLFLFEDHSWKNFILMTKKSNQCILKVKVSALLLKAYEKLLVIMMITTPEERFEHMFQGGTDPTRTLKTYLKGEVGIDFPQEDIILLKEPDHYCFFYAVKSLMLNPLWSRL